ncbi:hypothetical protein B0H67DRAFT_590245 [Lasiosphaeris hirsuta]|uniref:Uncharacterized protein n=1 Tax=Lasiosphaeris hirsuta TaxID=260670 RepID=A0AA40DQK4_9PEZI|nr:hypothetical protein B0H67DRAFT_590245 [Lasiosphaeris hirsuta]
MRIGHDGNHAGKKGRDIEALEGCYKWGQRLSWIHFSPRKKNLARQLLPHLTGSGSHPNN